jgi:hypothetical protein
MLAMWWCKLALDSTGWFWGVGREVEMPLDAVTVVEGGLPDDKDVCGVLIEKAPVEVAFDVGTPP